MGNGSIVPRQERFHARHALCCIQAHTVETHLLQTYPCMTCKKAAGWVNLPHLNDHPPPVAGERVLTWSE